MFASNNAGILEVFDKNIELEEEPELKAMMQKVSDSIVKYNKGVYIMTDDKAPVELLGMKVIDDLIHDEVEYYKNIYEQEGINAVISSFLG